MNNEKIKKELAWIRQFIHKKDDENVVIRDVNGKDIASWLDRVDAVLGAQIAQPAPVQEPLGYWNAVEGWVELPEEAHKPAQAKTIPKWPLKHQWVNGRGYVVWRDVFEGNMKCPLDEAIAAHAQAVFVDEGDAKEYCTFKNTTPPAQPAQQEPVAKVRVHTTGGNVGLAWSATAVNGYDSLPPLADGTLLYAAAQPAQQEPVAWAVFEGWSAHDLYLPQEYDEALKMAGYKGDHAEVKPLYTTPPAQPAPEFECPRCGHCCPQRQWVGLTGDEREQIYQEHYPDSLATTITAVENKLKEKNT